MDRQSDSGWEERQDDRVRRQAPARGHRCSGRLSSHFEMIVRANRSKTPSVPLRSARRVGHSSARAGMLYSQLARHAAEPPARKIKDQPLRPPHALNQPLLGSYSFRGPVLQVRRALWIRRRYASTRVNARNRQFGTIEPVLHPSKGRILVVPQAFVPLDHVPTRGRLALVRRDVREQRFVRRFQRVIK